MRRPPSARTGVVGLALVRLAVEEALGWIFREQPADDFGIDAQIEVVDTNTVRGKLLALQVKSGASYFREAGSKGWWYRPHEAHVRYWTNHVLPVVVILVHPQTRRCHWQVINSGTLIATAGGGWKLLVPGTNVLDERARDMLRAVADGDPYVLRVRELQLAIPWMRLLAEGKRLIVDIEQWVNKSHGRSAISLGVDNRDGKAPGRLAHWSARLAEGFPKLFSWANVSLHPETYLSDEHWKNAEVIEVDDERLVLLENGDWCLADEIPRLRPYRNVAGEVDQWRLELRLNDLGRAFLRVDEFVRAGDLQMTAVAAPAYEPFGEPDQDPGFAKIVLYACEASADVVTRIVAGAGQAREQGSDRLVQSSMLRSLSNTEVLQRWELASSEQLGYAGPPDPQQFEIVDLPVIRGALESASTNTRADAIRSGFSMSQPG